MAVILKEKDLDKVMEIEKLEKSHLYLNPLSLWRYHNMSEEKLKWEKVGEKEINIDLIETWAFVNEGLGPIAVSENILNMPVWDVVNIQKKGITNNHQKYAGKDKKISYKFRDF